MALAGESPPAEPRGAIAPAADNLGHGAALPRLGPERADLHDEVAAVRIPAHGDEGGPSPAAPRLGSPGPGVRGVPGGGRRPGAGSCATSRTQSGSRREMYAKRWPRRGRRTASGGGRAIRAESPPRRRRHNHDSGLKPQETLRRAGLQNAEHFSVDGAAATGRQWQGVSPRR